MTICMKFVLLLVKFLIIWYYRELEQAAFYLMKGSRAGEGSGKYSTGLKIRWSIFYYEK
jgi:hypothetical protein